MQKKIQLQRNKLVFEDGSMIYITKEMKQLFPFVKGESLTSSEYEALLRYRMKLSAYSWLSKRDYAKKELERKLVQSFGNRNWVLELLEELEKQGYMDDRAYAIQWIMAHPKYSKQKMEYMLRLQGIDREIIQESLEEHAPDAGEEIRKIWKKLGNKDREKKMMSLLRKGYRYSEIQEAISEKE